MRIAIFVVLSVLGVATVDASAQSDRRIHFNIAGGPVFPFSDIGDRFNIGWGPTFGVSLDVTDMLGVGVEYAYTRHYLDDQQTIDIGLLDAFHSMHALDFNLFANFAPRDATLRPYLVASPGMYYRRVSITQYQGTGVICDPWLYVCGAYPVEAVIGTRGGWDFGVSVGGGVGWQFEAVQFYVETRYKYAWGPESTLPTGETRTANGGYWPLTFGLRF